MTEAFSMVTLEPSIYSQIVVEIIRWNDIIRSTSVAPHLLQVN